jgi:hypothetical protein
MNEKRSHEREFPDRLSTNPSSPYYNEELLSRGRRHPLQGREKNQCRGILHQRRLDPRHRGNAKDRYGNPLTIKVHGPVEPVFPGQGVVLRHIRSIRHCERSRKQSISPA